MDVAAREFTILSRSMGEFSFWNYSSQNTTDFDSNLVPPEDVSVDAVITSIYLNGMVFIVLMISYECLRRLLPAVYSRRKRMNLVHAVDNLDGTIHEESASELPLANSEEEADEQLYESMSSLPDDRPLDWIKPVFGVPWPKVRKIAGLDGYFFLRYIRMNVRITAVSTFWFFLILVPIYFTGSNPDHHAEGWYLISAANIPKEGWRMWVPCIFAYLFTGFITFVIKQEYRHFLELRQDFLARGSAHVHPQHHYSLMVENIPYELRSDRALKDYFEKLFPGRVHSASVVLNLPDLEEASARCIRTCRRLEKSIAYLHATGERPTHVVGSGRMSLLGVDFAPLDCTTCSADQEVVVVDDNDRLAARPTRGTRVDSISYYTQELAAHSRALFKMQQRKAQIAESGNQSMRADNWLDKAVRDLTVLANRIMEDSVEDNSLLSPIEPDTAGDSGINKAEKMTSRYGSFSPATLPQVDAYGSATFHRTGQQPKESDTRKARLVDGDHLGDRVVARPDEEENEFLTPFGDEQYSSAIRRWAGRLGLDFVVAMFRVMNKQIDVALESVIVSTMSSTGFVTFLDLASTTCAASAPLSVKANVLKTSVAPEPREILWKNAHVSDTTQIRRELIVNLVLCVGAILWSFPLAAIQAFAKADFLAQIPGMEWILTFHGGSFTPLVNGYLPVVALLCLILVLPVVFEYIAITYERRKTFSDVQASMVGRYFYYQLANIYVSVTAGSILKSLADILDHPSNILQLLGESLPTMVGYFVALLVTKIMSGLPMIFLRFGALTRMLLLKTLSNKSRLTQRELDAIYRLENVQYGWEFPTQLLVVVIVFTYAIICPVILPFGLLYFVGALVVYKKQILYVYSPVYESGGAIFPIAVQRTLLGLVCGQMTLLGYTVTRGCYYQPLFLIPLPMITIYAMNFFRRTYADPSARLSLERAREYDRLSTLKAPPMDTGENKDNGVEFRRVKFDKNSYRQPVLTELAAEPLTYRRGTEDAETVEVRTRLRQLNRFAVQVQRNDASDYRHRTGADSVVNALNHFAI